MKKKGLLILVLALCLTLSLAGCGGNEEPAPPTPPAENTPAPETPVDGEYVWTQDYNWKMTHEGAPGDSPEMYFSERFAELINERSDGHIKIEIFNYSQLGSSADQFELVQNGTVEFGIGSAGAMSALVPEMSIFGLHYVYPSDINDMWDFLAESELTALLTQIMDENGFHAFCWDHYGAHVWSTNRAINSLSDMQGLKFRTQASQIEMASFNAYGANATTIAFAELYSALQLGTVDGQQQTGFGNNDMKYYEVAPYYIAPHASYYVDAPMCNSAFFNNLDPYVQDLLTECMLEARESLIEYVHETETLGAKDEALANGVTWIEFSPELQAEFAELAVSVRDLYLEIGGPRAQECLDTLLKDIGE